MAYTPNTWAVGDVITAEKMNHIEGGVQEAASNSGCDAIIWWKDSTDGWQVRGDFSNALAKMQHGIPIFVMYFDFNSTNLSSTYSEFFNVSLPISVIYDADYPTRIDISTSSDGTGFYWTADGVEYYD